MKLSEVKSRVSRDAEAVELPIVDDNNEPLVDSKGDPVVWLIRGEQCAERRRAEDIENQKMLARQADEASAEDIRSRRIALAAACVAGWRGVEDEDGSPLPCAPKVARQFLDADRKLLERVERRIREHGRFLAALSSSSAST